MAKAYKIRDCHATWNEKDGWNCECDGGHPLLCSPIIDVEPCEVCKGLGWIADVCDQGHFGHSEDCWNCDGTGEIEYTDDSHLERVRK